ncbi:MAG: acyl-CoA thioesterase [Elusimicrobia bacterium]|nr:acyl-CoA thioesterase [Elusimicrobiota bacterium]
MDLSGYKIKLPIQVRFRDTDAMGHVNNAVFLSLLELARVEYWATVTGSRDYTSMQFILVRVEIDFRSPIKLGDDICVYIRTSKMGRSSWEFDYKIMDRHGDRLVAEAKTVQCCFDYQRNKVQRMTDEFRKKMEEFDASA